jgi:Ran GTPase-activating protein (RanGAP) involved in mRNA processing and transport
MLLPRNSSTDITVLDLQDDVIQRHGSLQLAGKVIAQSKVLAMWIGTDFLEHVNPILSFPGE